MSAVKVLKKWYGISDTCAKYYCAVVGLNIFSSEKELTKEKLKEITKHLHQDRLIDIDLRRKIKENISKKVQYRTYVGVRHNQLLPVRGQRTKNNARTARKRVHMSLALK
jgi:small subunit ribosomal protein S13